MTKINYGVKSYKGIFIPKNPKKYFGDSKRIIFRSLLEKRYMKYFDTHDDIILWCSEEFNIPYISPLDRKPHRYFPDFLVRTKNNEVFCIEIKPYSQLFPPKKPKRLSKRFIFESQTWEVNQAKWAAAEDYCEKRGWKFVKYTEKDIKNK